MHIIHNTYLANMIAPEAEFPCDNTEVTGQGYCTPLAAMRADEQIGTVLNGACVCDLPVIVRNQGIWIGSKL